MGSNSYWDKLKGTGTRSHAGGERVERTQRTERGRENKLAARRKQCGHSGAHNRSFLSSHLAGRDGHPPMGWGRVGIEELEVVRPRFMPRAGELPVFARCGIRREEKDGWGMLNFVLCQIMAALMGARYRLQTA